MSRKPLAGRGTLLNFATVLIGGLLGLALRGQLQPQWLESVKFSLGIVTICFGLKMFLEAKNPVAVILSVALGGMIGSMVGIDPAVNEGANWVQGQLGGDGKFAEGLVVTSVLFCVGPMTLLGCIRDAIDRNIDLLKLKSTMDGIVAIFFAAAFGSGVIATAFVVLILQGAITLLASPLQKLADDQEMVSEITGTGGPVLVIVGLSLAGLKQVPSANYLPSLLLAPIIVLIFRYVHRMAARPSQTQ